VEISLILLVLFLLLVVVAVSKTVNIIPQSRAGVGSMIR
jgi:hypothetical protein